MKFNKVIMNPPYDGNLHLRILEKVLTVSNPEDGCEVVNISPVRWIQDPLAEYKQGSDYKKFKNSISDKLSSLTLIDATTACKAFNIMNGTDLAIYTFNKDKKFKNNILYEVAKTCLVKYFYKLNNLSNLKDKVSLNEVSGIRCEVKELVPEKGGHNLGDAESSKQCGVKVVLGPYTDGYTEQGIFFTETRTKNQHTKDYFPHSIEFDTLEIAKNFYKSCTCNFYKNLIFMLKWDVNVPLRFLPYMEDYSHVWTDEDYCKFFGLNEEESKFMCRTVDDYRVKDFINYEEF